MLYRTRETCSSGEFRLSNVVEIDETFVGGMEKNKLVDKKLKKDRGGTGKTA